LSFDPDLRQSMDELESNVSKLTSTILMHQVKYRASMRIRPTGVMVNI
jgi:hypothetical protein